MNDLASFAPLGTAVSIAFLVLGLSHHYLKQGLSREGRLISCYASIFLPAVALAFGLAHLADDMVGQHAGWCIAFLVLMGMGGTGGLAILGFCWQQSRIEQQGSLLAESASPSVQQSISQLSRQLGVKTPVVHILPTQRSMAFAVGIRQPRIYLAQWFLDHLTTVELEQVLAHELAHIQRQDNLIALSSTFFLGATFFLPTSWWAFRHLLRERELAADELAVRLTGKPIALARALVKVVNPEYALSPIPGLLQVNTIEQRIQNLVRLHQSPSIQAITQLEKIGLISLITLVPLPLAWLLFDLPHLLHLP